MSLNIYVDETMKKLRKSLNNTYIFSLMQGYHYCSTYVTFNIFSAVTYKCNFYSMSTLRLWYPQLSTKIEDYYRDHNATTYFCTMMDSYYKKTDFNITVNGSLDVERKTCVPVRTGL